MRPRRYPVLYEYGYSDDPGHCDHWPAGFVATWPNEGTARGTIVVDRGDIIFPFKSYVQTPIRVDFEDGFITEISAISTPITCGNSSRATTTATVSRCRMSAGGCSRGELDALGMMDKAQTNGNDGRAYYGNFMFSTGPNDDAGGPRDTLCHLDIPMRNCSVWLDDEPMLLKGQIVPEDSAPRAADPAGVEAGRPAHPPPAPPASGRGEGSGESPGESLSPPGRGSG